MVVDLGCRRPRRRAPGRTSPARRRGAPCRRRSRRDRSPSWCRSGPACSRSTSSRVAFGLTATRVRVAVDLQMDHSFHGVPLSLRASSPRSGGAALAPPPAPATRRVSTLTSSQAVLPRGPHVADRLAPPRPPARPALTSSLVGQLLAAEDSPTRRRQDRRRAPPRPAPARPRAHTVALHVHQRRRGRGHRQRERRPAALAQVCLARRPAGEAGTSMATTTSVGPSTVLPRPDEELAQREPLARPPATRRAAWLRGPAGSAPCPPRARRRRGCRPPWPGCAPGRRRGSAPPRRCPG